MGIFSFLKSEDSEKAAFDWKQLTEESQLQEIIEASKVKPQVLFKHSTRCSISSMALTRFEREGKELLNDADVYYLDLITYRPISNAIAEELNVVHQSPQAIVLVGGKVIYDASHSDISATTIIEKIK